MKILVRGSLVGALALALLLAACTPAEQPKTVSVTVGPPPETRVDDVVDTLHGVEVPDPYRWLEDQESAETRAWIETQNTYTDSVMQQLPGQEELTALFTKLVKVDSISTPNEQGGKYFYTRRAADQDLSVIYVRDGLEGEERVLLDPHPLSEDHTTSVSMMDISDDGALMVYDIRKGGVDEIEVHIMDVATGQDLPDVLPTARYWGATLTPDKSGMYYTRHGAEGPRVMYHKLGTDIATDTVIFGEGYGPEKILYGGLSENGKWLLAVVIEGSSGPTEIYCKPATGRGVWATVINDGKSRSYPIDAGDKLLIQTDLDAPNGRVMIADFAKPGQANWKELLPHNPNAVLQGVFSMGGKVIANYLENVQDIGRIYEMDGTLVREIALDSIGSFGSISGHFDSTEMFFSFSSFHIPPTIYRYDITTGEKTVWATIAVPVDSASMELKQVTYTSKDGTSVPMFILHKKDLVLDGTNPTLMTGYGGFNASMTPNFSASAVAWAELGGVFALPNLRGGGEFGEAWHQAGMFGNKQNVFDDFHAAAQYLIDNKYTSPAHLGISGGSNGGLLVGAAMTQRPELYGAVVCTYPLLDMIRYQNFLVARFWVPEYGSSEDPEQFPYLLAYSPYHNVKEGVDYPATLFITGDGDTRVAPLHARKMCALLQAKNSGKNPVMIRYHIKAGHSGGMPISEIISNNVETFSFLRWRLSGE